MAHQDWTTVTLEKSKTTYKGGANKSNSDKKKKPSGASHGPSKKKVEEEMEDFRTAKISKSFSVALQRARLNKGWKQQQLAQQLNVRQTVINQYESGKAVPSPQLIARMNRILGVKLPPIKKPGKQKKKKKSDT